MAATWLAAIEAGGIGGVPWPSGLEHIKVGLDVVHQVPNHRERAGRVPLPGWR